MVQIIILHHSTTKTLKIMIFKIKSSNSDQTKRHLFLLNDGTGDERFSFSGHLHLHLFHTGSVTSPSLPSRPHSIFFLHN